MGFTGSAPGRVLLEQTCNPNYTCIIKQLLHNTICHLQVLRLASGYSNLDPETNCIQPLGINSFNICII